MRRTLLTIEVGLDGVFQNQKTNVVMNLEKHSDLRDLLIEEWIWMFELAKIVGQ